MTSPSARKPKPASRPRSAGLSRERIAVTALELVDREGLQSLTARRLAKALGCEAMSIYHYFESMEHVLDAVADRLLISVEMPVAPAAPDLEGTLRALARRYSALALRRPRAFPLVAARRLRTATAVEKLADGVRLLVAQGMEPRAAVRCLRILIAYLNGAGLALAAWRVDPEPGPRGAGSEEARRLLPGLDVAAVSEDLEAGIALLTARLAAAPPAKEVR